MNCQDILFQRDDYLEQRLPPPSREEIRQHLVDCEECRTAFEMFDRLTVVIDDLPRIQAPENFETVLRQRMHNSAIRFQPTGQFQWQRFWLLAASLILFVTALFVFRPDISQPAAPDRPVQNRLTDIPGVVMDIPIPAADLTADNQREMIRFVAKDYDTGEDVFVELPAAYRLRDYQNLETAFVKEVSH